MKTLEEMKSWYIDAVKAQLILNFAITERQADQAVRNYRLREKLDADPNDQLNNSIEGIAEDIARRDFIGRPCSLTYKGYRTEIRYDSSLKHLYGKIEGISEFISFEASVSKESSDGEDADIESAFHRAVDDYLSFCAERDIVPETGMEDAFAGDEEALAAWRRRHGIRDAGKIYADSMRNGESGRTGALSDPEVVRFNSIIEQIRSAGADMSHDATTAGKIADIGSDSQIDSSGKEVVTDMASGKNGQSDSQSDADFLKSFGIDPYEETLDSVFMPDAAFLDPELSEAVYGHSTQQSRTSEAISENGEDEQASSSGYAGQVDARTGIRREDLLNMESDQFLRYMGIDPDDVIL